MNVEENHALGVSPLTETIDQMQPSPDGGEEFFLKEDIVGPYKTARPDYF